ncbi:MAG TPA: hypothetical protein VFS33_11835 [Gemmatimonadales bacterium]|nr:hypothetical protein [Gemmatimonadales bacterium]
MSDAAEPLAVKQDLQFDTLQTTAGGAPEAGAPTCQECRRPIADRYYEVLGLTVCERCRESLATKFSGKASAGRLLRASLFGAGAAVIGAALYYAVGALTGYNFALIAIVVGWLVGRAVQRGGASGGGWQYQALAVGLTYLAIASTYVPTLIEQFNDASGKALAQVERRSAPDSAPAARSVAIEPTAGSAADSAAGSASANASTNAPTRAATKADASTKPITPAGFLGGLLLLAGLIVALPILANVLDMPSGILGLIILFVGLHQAWRMNKRVELAFNGPFQVGAKAQTPGTAA